MSDQPAVRRYRSLIFALLLSGCGAAVWAMIAWPHNFAVHLIAVAAVLAAAKVGQSPALRRQRPRPAPGAAVVAAPPGVGGPDWLFHAAVAVTVVCGLGVLASIWFMAATLTVGGPSKIAPDLFVGFLFVGALAASYLAQRRARLAAAAPRRRARAVLLLGALTALFTVGWLAAFRSWLGAVAHGGRTAPAMDLFVAFLFASVVTSAYLVIRVRNRT